MKIAGAFLLVLFVVVHCSVIKEEEEGEEEKKWNEIYCDRNPNHVFCLAKKDDNARKCTSNVEMTRVPQQGRNAILRNVNKFRSDLAKNEITFKGDSKIGEASQMNKLKWDMTLESLAFARCRICSEEMSKPEDIKLIDSFIPGEMVAVREIIIAEEKTTIIGVITNIWIPFVVQFTADEANNNGRLPYEEFIKAVSGQTTESYSIAQLLKDDLYLIGCAKSKTIVNNKDSYIYACFLGPTTWSKTDKVIRNSGEPASKCILKSELGGLCDTSDDAIFPSVEVLLGNTSASETISVDEIFHLLFIAVMYASNRWI